MRIRVRKLSNPGVIVLLLAGSLLGPFSSASAQTINDANQDQTYGAWRVANPQYPGIQVRAKCDRDTQDSDGRVTSWWDFQIRSTYKETVDYVYLNEAGIASPKTNVMIGPFLDTAKPGETKSGYGVMLWGSCSQHATPKTALHINIKCGVPTGQDAPCFKDSSGNPYERRDPSESAKSGGGSPATGGGRQTRQSAHAISPQKDYFWLCLGVFTEQNNKGYILSTTVFESQRNDDAAYDFGVQFSQWFENEHTGVHSHLMAIRGGPDTLCRVADTREAVLQKAQDDIDAMGGQGFNRNIVWEKQQANWTPH